MAQTLGTQAVVIGGGMGGLGAAAALSPHFEHVVLLDRDDLPLEGTPRKGVPQGRHLHALLAGGHGALSRILPGFEQALIDAGAVPMRVGLDILVEMPAYTPFPRRDLGFVSYAASRPQIEAVTRRCTRALPNLRWLKGTAQALLTEGDAVVGAKVKTAEGPVEDLPATLTIDASGRGELTLAALEVLGFEAPETSRIGVDLAYSTAMFRIPKGGADDWKGVMTLPMPPDSRGGLMMPLEEDRWILSTGGRPGQHPPGDWDAFMEFVASLRTSSIHDAIKDAERIGDIQRFRFPESRWRHYEKLERFPEGILPLGDSICRFNPIYGQGMSVAAQEAAALAAQLAGAERLSDIPVPFFAAAAQTIETPWFTSAIPDFVFPQTEGERPPDLQTILQFGQGLDALCARDAEAHRLRMRVQHLLEPRSALQDPKIVEAVLGILAEQAAPGS